MAIAGSLVPPPGTPGGAPATRSQPRLFVLAAVSIAMGVFDYLEEAQPFLTKMSQLTRGVVLASFPKFSLVRGAARRLRYRLTRRGDVFYYTADDISRLALLAGLK